MRFIDRVKAAVHRGPAKWESMRMEPSNHPPADPGCVVFYDKPQSPGMERHPHSWAGIDRDGNPKSGETLMRDKTVGAMIEGFYAAGYQRITVTRDGIEYEGVQRQPS